MQTGHLSDSAGVMVIRHSGFSGRAGWISPCPRILARGKQYEKTLKSKQHHNFRGAYGDLRELRSESGMPDVTCNRKAQPLSFWPKIVVWGERSKHKLKVQWRILDSLNSV